MPVKKDPSGRRSVHAEVEVPGTPAEVWQAIATGPGISSWFVPTELEGRVGGTTTSSFGPGMDAVASITVWDPPHRYVAESRDDMGLDGPTVATEWIVEARSGGACTVRVVHSWFTSSDAWDDQFEGHTYGWRSFFRVLRLYLASFSGQPNASFQVIGVAAEPKADAWAAMTDPLGLGGANVGSAVKTPAGEPRLAGTVEWAGQPEWPEDLLIRLDEPAPGIAHFACHAMGGQVMLTLRFYLYGTHVAAAISSQEPLWQAWVNAHFAMPVAASSAD
jgi:uncharacterized protein YndB with AHSA1/START domain